MTIKTCLFLSTELTLDYSSLQACIKPVEVSKKDEVTDEAGDGGITINKSKGWKARAQKKSDDSAIKLPEAPKPLNVTLGDCLACSGCITSAEAVLIAEQSHEKVLEVLERKKKVLLNGAYI